jgi:hypothetical protein
MTMRTRKKWTTRKSRKFCTEKRVGMAESLMKMILLRLNLGRITKKAKGGGFCE